MGLICPASDQLEAAISLDRWRQPAERRNAGPLLWFEHATDYEDLYGYSPGPRPAPVDDDRVTSLDQRILHCLTAPTARCSGRSTRKGSTPRTVGSVPIEGDLLIVSSGYRVARGRPTCDQDGTGIVAFDSGRQGDVSIDRRAGLLPSPIVTTIDGRRWALFRPRRAIGFGEVGKVASDSRGGRLKKAPTPAPGCRRQQGTLRVRSRAAFCEGQSRQGRTNLTDKETRASQPGLPLKYADPCGRLRVRFERPARERRQFRCVTPAADVAGEEPVRASLTLVDGPSPDRTAVASREGEPEKYEPVAKWAELDYPSGGPGGVHGLMYIRQDADQWS